MTQLSDTSLTEAAVFSAAHLLRTAQLEGAKKSPSVFVAENGLVGLRLQYDAQPAQSEIDPWLRALGHHRIDRIPFEDRGTWYETSVISGGYHGHRVTISVVYPYNAFPGVEVKS